MTRSPYSPSAELARVSERVILPKVKGGKREALEPGYCRSLLVYIIIPVVIDIGKGCHLRCNGPGPLSGEFRQ